MSLTRPTSPVSRFLALSALAICWEIPSAVHAQIARFDGNVLTWEGTGVRPANGHSSAAVRYGEQGLLPLASSADTTTNYTVDNSPVAIWKELCSARIEIPAGGFETVSVTMTINDATDVGAQLILTSQGEQWQLSPALRTLIKASRAKHQAGMISLPNVVITGKVVRQTAAGAESTVALSSDASIVSSDNGTCEVVVRGPAPDMQYSVRPGNGIPDSGGIAIWRQRSTAAAQSAERKAQPRAGR